jgi:hypothetical protein
MREVRNITVAVSPELYRQTRKLAAEMDSTVTAMVAYLLERFPSFLKGAGFKVTIPPGAPHHLPGRPPHGIRPGTCCPTCGRQAPPIAGSEPEKPANSRCISVNSAQPAKQSATSALPARVDTAAVSQYGDRNEKISLSLHAKSDGPYSRCIPVWKSLIRSVIARKEEH